MIRVLMASSNIFFSLVLGALAMATVWYNWPATIPKLFNAASGVKSWITTRGIADDYNNFLLLLIDERQLVLMGFVIVSRVVLAILMALGSWFLRIWREPTTA